MPAVSVVIPTYNKPDLLMETLGTVFAQTFDDYEIIVINDGSTDDTLNRLGDVQREHSEKMRIVTQANAGIGAARNRGLDEATGRYIALLDHDDLWMPRKLEKQVQYLESHPQCVAAGTCFALSGTPQRPHFTRADVADENGIVERPFWQTIHGKDVFLTSTLMVRRDRIAGIRYGTARGPIEDVQFHIKLMTRGSFGIAGEEILAIYRIHESNASKNPEFYYGGIKILREMQSRGEFSGLSPLLQRDMNAWLGNVARTTAVMQIRLGRRSRGLELYVKEFPHQVREGRARFLATFPVMLLMPLWAIDMAYAMKYGRSKRMDQDEKQSAR
jgi:glycosyltransferase involved in cell wall biosynthesis